MARAVALLRVMAVTALAAMALAGCGSRLRGDALRVAEGANKAGASAETASGVSSGATTGPSSNAAGTALSSGPATADTGGAGTAAATGAAACDPSNNGGATDIGVTSTQIHIGNITSITGVAPGLTQSAQQATEAVADYVNSQGGICGRRLVVDAYDDGNTTTGNYTAARQACGTDFALVGGASGFDDGSASAVGQCGIPDVAAEESTQAATNTADIYGANPGDLVQWPKGPAIWLQHSYPNAVTHAAMLYLNVPATIEQAQDEMKVYESEGFDYIYTASVSPTEPNYAPYVQNMEGKGVQYVTEISDDNSAARLALAMQQANFKPAVTDWFAEMYSPAFLSETQGDAVGDLVEITSASYEDTTNPGMQLFEAWMNRVAPGWTHDIFAEFAWSAGLAFTQAAKTAGTHLTRANLLSQLKAIGTWDGGGVQPPLSSFGQKVDSPCFAYMKITANGFARAYPSAPGSYDCSGGLYKF